MTLADYVTIGVESMQIVGFIIVAFMYLRRPQEKSVVIDAVLKEKIETLDKNITGLYAKVDTLDQNVTNLKDNHIHTLDEKINSFVTTQGARNETVSNTLTQIITMMDERFPKKRK